MVDILEFLDDFQIAFGKDETYRRARLFMVAYLKLLANRLSGLGRESLAVGDAYNSGEVTAKALDEARVKCWALLTRGPNDVRITEIERDTARVVIPCLFATSPSGDVAELVVSFLQRANLIESHSETVEPLLDEFFGSPSIPLKPMDG